MIYKFALSANDLDEKYFERWQPLSNYSPLLNVPPTAGVHHHRMIDFTPNPDKLNELRGVIDDIVGRRALINVIANIESLFFEVIVRGKPAATKMVIYFPNSQYIELKNSLPFWVNYIITSLLPS